jgi:hypothetical protein
LKTQQLDPDTKAIVIEVMDIFNEMDVEELLENADEKEEFRFHVKVIFDQLAKAREEGYKRYALLTRAEAERQGQDLGLNGIYLLVVRR